MEQKKTITVLVCDIDGSEGASTVQFGLDGKNYRIELSEKHETKLRKFLAPYVENARADRKKPKRSSGNRSKQPNAADVRAWAAESGVEVNATGRIPKTVIDQYQAAS